MPASPRDVLDGWGDFSLITGGAAAALTGLQFVVQTLIATDLREAVGDGDPEAGIAAFGTPTVVHFAIALVVSTMLAAPWPSYPPLRAALIVVGGASLGYAGVVLRRALRQRAYAPQAEDWIWHLTLPAIAYAGMVVGGLMLRPTADWPLFVIAAATLLLLCIGIHNAWDTVTYLTLNTLRPARAPDATTQPDDAAVAPPPAGA